MMKKSVILLAVLAMATVAKAALVLYPRDLASMTDLYIQTDPIDVVDVQQAVFLALGGSGMAMSGPAMSGPA